MGQDEPDGAGGGAQLQKLLAGRARSLAEAAVRSGGQVGAEDLETLGRLARLTDIARAAEPPVRPRRWPVVAFATASLGVVSALVFAPVPATDIELSASLSGVQFELAARQTLADATALAALGVAGLRRIDVPSSCLRGAATVPLLDGAAVHMSVASAGARHGALALAALTLPAGTVVRVQHSERPREYRLSLTGLTQPVLANVHGPIRLVVSGNADAILDCATPRPVALHAAPDDVDLDLTFLDTLHSVLQRPVRQLALARVEHDPGPGGGPRLVSTVLAGMLYFEFNGAERKLRAGEAIRFAESSGEIRALRWDQGHIALDFRGRVRGMTTGRDDRRRSLMPSPLDWLRASQGDLAVLWGATLYVMGFVLAVLRWWRNPA